MFTLVCSIAAFSVSTAKYNVTHLHKKKYLFLAFLSKNLLATCVIRKLMECRFCHVLVSGFVTHA